MMDTITKRQTLRLIRALESGKYKKTSGRLCNKSGDAFCCLGVQADINRATWETDRFGNLYPKGNLFNKVVPNTSTLETKWAGGLSHETQTTLATLNDHSRTFKPVVKYLREEVLPKAL